MLAQNCFSDGMCDLNSEENALTCQGVALLFLFFLSFCFLLSRPLYKTFSLPGKLSRHHLSEAFLDHPTNASILHHFLRHFIFLQSLSWWNCAFVYLYIAVSIWAGHDCLCLVPAPCLACCRHSPKYF